MTERKAFTTRVTTSNSNTRLATGLLPKRAAFLSAPELPRSVNSNTRIVAASPTATSSERGAADGRRAGAVSEALLNRLRHRMVVQLVEQGIQHQAVLQAMLEVPRHLFVDEAWVSRAYENDALPIGAGQTISHPWIVARMLAIAFSRGRLGRVLEVGTGCGYQAAVMSHLADHVVSVERIRSLHEQAAVRLSELGIRNVQLELADGRSGWPAGGAYEAIVVAAAGLDIPQALLTQMAVGGVLVAPEGGEQQRLVLIERVRRDRFERTELEVVRFVPLQTGVKL